MNWIFSFKNTGSEYVPRKTNHDIWIFLILFVLAFAAIVGYGRYLKQRNTLHGNTLAAHSIVTALSEYPGNGLYQPAPGPYIDLDTEAGDLTADASVSEIDYDTWKEALGDCFAEKCFDSFYYDSARTAILDHAMAQGITLTIVSIDDGELDGNIQHFMVTVKAEKDRAVIDDFMLDYRIIYSKDDLSRIQKAELADYGDFIEKCR